MIFVNATAMDDESSSLDSGEESYSLITKIIGEMKNTFNKADTRQVPFLELGVSGDSNNMTETNVNSHSADMPTEDSDSDLESKVKVKIENVDAAESSDDQQQLTIDENLTLFDINDNKEIKQENEVEEINNKPRIVMYFRKPAPAQSPKRRTSSEELNRRSLRAKMHEEAEIKRSIRRRRSRDYGESILQSAIARKEKSYNEESKPQRSTRQLKPTQKILENLANAAAVKEKNKLKTSKSTEKQIESDIYMKTEENTMQISVDSERLQKKHKFKHHFSKSLKRASKRLKSNVSDVSKSSDSDQNFTPEVTENESNLENGRFKTNKEKHYRRSQRLSSSRCKDKDLFVNVDDIETPEASLAEQESMYPADPECSSVGAELIASKLCLCSQTTQFYASVIDSEIFCMAVDSVGEKLIGCNNIVNSKMVSMIRPSGRIPYTVLCEVHKNRMLRHNCCPTCGIFCTQGTFVECANKHQYHRKCQISVGNAECCPHCGSSSPDHDVSLTMYSSKNPIFLLKQRKSYPLAKITFQQNSYEEIKRSRSPILAAIYFDFTSSPNYTEEYCDIDDLLQVIKEEDYEKLAFILGSKRIQLMTSLNYDDCSIVLHYSAKNGLLPAVHMLVVAGMELDVLDKDQNTPLMVAVLAFKNDVVKYLIRAGASIIFKGTDGMTALHLAADCGNLKACELLIEAAIDKREYINCGDDGGWTSLVWACEHNHINIVQYLLRKGADPLLRDLKQNVALHWSAFSGCEKIVELLLKYGSDINVVNAQGDTPLHIGTRQENYNAVIVLLIRGANVLMTNKAGETPLDCCTEQDSNCYHLILFNMQLQQNAVVKSTPIILTNDISRGRELNPIQCINTVDKEPKPTDFVYVSENCLTSDVNIEKKITSLQSCVCEDNCISNNCQCASNSLMHCYDEDGRLLPDFHSADSPMIFECNQMCLCNSLTCNNRVVQRGLSQRFQLFRTENKGWGIKTLRLILRGSFVCEYIGEILTDVEADQREDDSYMFDLDNQGNETFCIDAKHYGNLSRFINHSCEPNLIPVKVFIEHQDLRFPRIALFANRDILANEEICFDYGEKFWIIKYKSFTCDCQSDNCKFSEETIQATLENYNLRIRELAA